MICINMQVVNWIHLSPFGRGKPHSSQHLSWRSCEPTPCYTDTLCMVPCISTHMQPALLQAGRRWTQKWIIYHGFYKALRIRTQHSPGALIQEFFCGRAPLTLLVQAIMRDVSTFQALLHTDRLGQTELSNLKRIDSKQGATKRLVKIYIQT